MSRAKNQVVIYKSEGDWKTTKPNTSKMCTWFVTSNAISEYYHIHADQVIPFLLKELNQLKPIERV